MDELKLARETKKAPIAEICQDLGIAQSAYEPYGNYIAKVNLPANSEIKNDNLILVTAMNSTPAGEGKTTTSIGLTDAMNAIGDKTVLALREPSMGPVMGRKGGATGGGYSQVVPRDEIDLHFTGDFHALQIANNTLAALIDNDIYQGNPHHLDPKSLIFTRILDVNDRSLRQTVIGLGTRVNGVMRQEQFEITAASELMAILCLARDYRDLKNRIGHILVGYTYEQKPVQVADLNFVGPIAAILAKALKPNLVQTLAHNPVFIHGGPFANIAHGANSILATKLALTYGDYAITEAGFGSDLGAEKFIDLVSQSLEIMPKVIVIVASIRSLKFQVQASMTNIQAENLADVRTGYANLRQHVKNLQSTGIKVVVAINQFSSDTAAEMQVLTTLLDRDGFSWAISQTFEKGAKGGLALAELVHRLMQQKAADATPFYQMNDDLKSKINQVATKVYHASNVVYSAQAEKAIQNLKEHHWDHLPICIAKTPQSFTDDPQVLGAPQNFTLHIRDISPKLGAGFLVVYTGKILTMPGLPQNPAALAIDIDDTGTILGPV